jgi:hypothetical protein
MPELERRLEEILLDLGVERDRRRLLEHLAL